MIEYIQMAQETLDLSIYEYKHPILASYILDAHTRNVKVRIICDDEE